MATLRKLQIQGIRSFEPDNDVLNRIEFCRPMTLIVGQNGCGKTTIIEALKYAITSEFPPGTQKGQTFVNDPKLSTGYEVPALVRLEVVNEAKGYSYVITRRLKATQKGVKGNISVSTVEGTIRRKDTATGGVQESSSKCVDLKVEMCRIMGVPEPILNNVIFCHQEDSCWPLDEASKVKAKFDAIFNTTMYIKCVDQLIKKEKEIAVQIKVAGESLHHATEIKHLTEQKRKELDVKNVQLHKANDDKTEFEGQLGELEKKLKILEDMEKEYSKINSKVEEKKGNIKAIKSQIAELRGAIKESFTDDIDTLRKTITNFKVESLSKQQSLKKKESELGGVNSNLDRLSGIKNSFLVKQGQFQQEDALNRKRIANVKTRLQKLVVQMKKFREQDQDSSFSHSMDSFLTISQGTESSESSQLDAAIKALSGAIRMKDEEYERVQSEFESKEKDLQKTIDELRAKKVSLETEIGMKGKQIQENKNSVTSLKKRLNDIEGCHERLELLDEEESTFAHQIEEIESSGILEKCDNEIETLNGDIKDLEKKISNLNAEVKLLLDDKAKLDQIAFFNRQKQEKNNSCKTLLRNRHDELASVIGDVPEEGLAKLLDNKLKSLKVEINSKEKELKEKERKSITNESELKRVSDSLSKNEKTLIGIKKQLEDVLDDKDFDTSYSEVSEQLDATQKSSYYAEAAQYLFKKNIQKLKKKDCCPLCNRDFEAKAQVNKLIAEIEKDIEKMVRKEPQDESAVQDLKEKQRTLLDLKPKWEQSKKLENDEIPALKKKKEELEPIIQQINEDIESLNDTLTLLKNDQSTGANCTNDIALYEQNLKEIKKQDDNIAGIEKTRNSKAKAIGITLTDAQNKLKDMEGTIKAKKVEKDNKDDLRNLKRKDLADFQQRKNKVQEEKLTLTQEMQNREALEKQKKDLEELNKKLQEFITESTGQLPSAKQAITEAESKKQSTTKEKEKTLKVVQSEKEGLTTQKNDLMKLNSEINEFEKNRDKFTKMQQEAEECNIQWNEYESKKKELEKQIDSFKNDLSSRETKQRDLTDNLSIKEKEIQMEKLQAEVAEQEKLLVDTTTKGVAGERRELSKQHQSINAKYNTLIGRREEIQKSVATFRRELAMNPYSTADEDYKTKLITKVIYEKTKKDVIRYKTALDHAILTFHRKRMEQINKLLRELWRTIYKGNDIDYIQIKTENANASEGPAPKVEVGKVSRKTYNYRVVQVRRGIEMDLRGRCSAGQKVLASLIIRIALAHTFSAKCGIIALDEPTTNLDQRNINSLAETLANFAVEMSRVKNFQLIVITHDQDFIERLLAVDHTDYYYKVSRNEKGFSQIHRNSKQLLR